MQLYPLVLIAVILMADGGLGLSRPEWAVTGVTAAAAALIPIAVILLATWGGVRWCARVLERRGRPAAIVAADRITRLARTLLVLHFVGLVMLMGWLEAVRRAVGDLVAVDELLAMAPTLAALTVTWWIYYPIERRLRQAVLIRQLDEGRAVFPTPTRGQYVATQFRTQVLFLLLPVALIVAAAEGIDAVARRLDDLWWVPWAGEAATICTALGIVIFAPWLSRAVLEVRPLPDGPLREELLAVCSRHRVAVRQLLVWNTHGAMINAAVMGLFGAMRYVLMTDALLESMTRRQIEAVMAHEIGHIRRHHMPWLLVALLACVITVAAPLLQAGRLAPAATADRAGLDLLTTGVVIGGALAVLALFGWISRRFERQADTFAVRHVNDGTAITEEAVAVVAGALGTIARLNAFAATRWSWRHGSIAWRQAYLASLVGCDASRLSIDRQVRWIKTVAALIVVVGLTWAGISARAAVPVQPRAAFHLEDRYDLVMSIPFTKMHGAGNDFVCLDAIAEPALGVRRDLAALSEAMCDRRFGIGGDGLIVIGRAEPWLGLPERHSVRMRMFNADGSESEMCGNGLRCVVKYALDRELAGPDEQGRLLVQTLAGVKEAVGRQVDGAIGAVTVDMGPPVLELAEVPVDRAALAGGVGPAFRLHDNGDEYEAVFVSMGNPHAVIHVEDVGRIDLASVGPRLEHHAAFPHRINVHFVQVAGPAEVTVRTWERGSGITGACGSGACAVCVAGVVAGRTEPELLAHLPGGDLTLQWAPPAGRVLMTGPAAEVFSGSWPAPTA